ncbi:MAG: hypothetical protein UZ17_ACD001000801 [Acidobacteria bacterium OLB17]|nr:MAG: hypothetical protein UZ17_ACD001000801 [Acidobacteria bacterium OLB17]
MKKEGWVTESRTNILRITHWGVAEAKKVAANGPDSKRQAEREARRLLSETREFIVLIEEYLADPSDEHLDGVSTKFSNISKALEALKKA